MERRFGTVRLKDRYRYLIIYIYGLNLFEIKRCKTFAIIVPIFKEAKGLKG